MHDPSEHNPVFWDPTARRAKIVRAIAGASAAVAAVFLGIFLFSLATSPHLGAVLGRAVAHHAPPPPHDRRFLAARRALLQRITLDEKKEARAKQAAPSHTAYGAYFAPWVAGALADFNAHAPALNYVYPSWLAVGADGRSITATDMRPADAAALTRIARANGVKIIPVVSNASNARFDAKRMALMLRNPERGRAVEAALVSFVVGNGYDGLQIDFEMFDPSLANSYQEWLNHLAVTLHARGKELSATMQATQSDDAIRAVAAATDYLVPMAYDEHGDAGSPGPVGSISFVNRTLARFAALVPANKLMLGVGAYGYDWARAGGEPQTVTNGEAVALARGFRPGERIQDVIDFDSQALEPTFTYSDENGAGHEVWFLDGVTTANAMQLARSYHTRGATLWALGMEDATSWRAFGDTATTRPDLHALPPPGMPAFVGHGELLHVLQPPTAGARSYETDPKLGLITDETYDQIPSNWLVGRTGALDHKIALTFDDGPDPKWTAQILDLLKTEKVKATFFVIGENAVAEPDLVRRIYREGHEIGNHSFTHPNMAHVGAERVRLELTACQRALESIIGRSVRLFRPPYNADADPSSYGEIFPVAVADSAGYVTAGESIDPEDWDLNVRTADGVRRLTAADIEANVLNQLDRGHAILFHDGGGDRSATVEAARRLIPILRARGYEFVTMGALGGMSEATTMPALSARDKSLAAIDDTIFNVQRIAGAILFIAFSASIALGLLRIVLMLGLASGRRERPPILLERPRVDVVIAAYNEETVIADTIASVMQSRNVDFRVIVVNDGSTDKTEAIVRELAARDGRIVFISKANGGKASALNAALSVVTAPIMVGIDGDTHVDQDALAALAEWFAIADIGAVAGNVQVGNPQNVITRWQAIEYVTSQNIDRRALARLNAVTVVPGAIGAWRVDAVRAVGGYVSDTLAEDMDLTWRLHIAGWRIANEPRARAYTEAPATLSALLKQRFRWTYGTLQCLFKHAGATFHYGWFGKLALPSLWLFQIVAQVLAPFVDIELFVALFGRAMKGIESIQHEDVAVSDTTTVWWIIGVYLAFVTLELVAGIAAFKLDRGDAGVMWLQPLQRFVYRQIMYLVAWRAIGRALAGASQAWGKLRRTGAVAQFGKPEITDRAA